MGQVLPDDSLESKSHQNLFECCPGLSPMMSKPTCSLMYILNMCSNNQLNGGLILNWKQAVFIGVIISVVVFIIGNLITSGQFFVKETMFIMFGVLVVTIIVWFGLVISDVYHILGND